MIHSILPVSVGETRHGLTWYDDTGNKGLADSDVTVPCQDAFGPPKVEAEQNIYQAPFALQALHRHRWGLWLLTSCRYARYPEWRATG